MGDKILAPEAERPGNVLTLFDQMREKHVFRIAVAYAVAAWVVIQVVATVGPAFDLPSWVLRVVVVLAVAGCVATVAAVTFTGSRQRVSDGRSLRRVIVTAAIVIIITGAGTLFAYRAALAVPKPQIAVLPFEDLSPTHDKAYFAEGVAEQILTSLSTDHDLQVLGRTSAREIKGDADPADIRKKLGVTHLLEGSARTAGDALRVNVRLVDTSNGASIWEEEYHGRLSDIFAVQDQIAQAVVQRLRTTFFQRDSARAAPATKVDAYEAYLAARTIMRARTKPALTKALELARRVIASDPGFAPGQALYAELLIHLSDDTNEYGDIPVETARRVALPHARRAIALAPASAEGYAALSQVLPIQQSLPSLERAIQLDPARGELRMWLEEKLTRLGRYDEAFEQAKQAVLIEPLWSATVNRLVLINASSGRFDEALAQIDRFEHLGGEKAQALRFRSSVARRMGQHARAIAYGEQALAANPALPYVAGQVAMDYALLHLSDRASAAMPNDTQGLLRLLAAGQRDQLYGQARSAGPALWKRPDLEVGIRALASARDWPALSRLYQQRGASSQDVCTELRDLAIPLTLALARTGDGNDARALLACIQGQLDRTLHQSSRSADSFAGDAEFAQSRLLGVRGDREGALRWLKRAIDRGWLGYFYSSDLHDWPEFDALQSDPRLSVLQQRIDRAILGQRAQLPAPR